MNTRHPEDITRYTTILESTQDDEGVCHRDEAITLFTNTLILDEERIVEYAGARAAEVADRYDRAHSPETHAGQMSLDFDTVLVIGANERVPVDRAMSKHTRQWLDVGAGNFARQAAAWAAKDTHGRRLLAIQDQLGCSMFEAEKHLQEEGTS